jgi:hypothetical protein
MLLSTLGFCLTPDRLQVKSRYPMRRPIRNADRMSDWRPLSKRGQPDERLDEPTEGLPPYLAGPLIGWLRERFESAYGGASMQEKLEILQLKFKLDPSLEWQRGAKSALRDLLERVASDEEFGLDVIDFVLNHIRSYMTEYENQDLISRQAESLLRLGGSAWEVTANARGSYALSRRAVGPVRESLETVRPATRAHQHLVRAWNHLTGRNPDHSASYREAVRAVEAAAKPIILPENDRATLGQMIAAIRDKGEKWTVTLGSPDDIRRLMEIVWTAQLDRHGTDDEAVPLTVSAEQADAAFSLCLNLSRLFAGGHVVRKA